MVCLLPKERPVADLRLGIIQTITEDIFARRTMVLSDRRLWLIEKQLFSHSISIVFLKDITAIEARHTLQWARCLFASLFMLAGLIIIVANVRPEHSLSLASSFWGSLICFIAALLLYLFAFTKSVFVYTTMKSIQFRLALTFSTKQIEAFVNSVQNAMSQYKN
jgi:hypothetical protein